MKKFLKKISLGIMLILTGLVVSACLDKNIPKPDELVTDTSVAVSDFTVDNATITLGESTILRWEVEDKDDKINYVFISEGVGTVAESGSKQVTPQKSTIYTLTIYVNNKAAKSRSLQITVISPSGSEVVDEPVAEVCDDEIDNDLDAGIDCDDDDCVEAENCLAQVPEEVVYGFSKIPSAPEGALVGLETVISWESNFEDVFVKIKDTEYTRVGNDSVPYVPQDDKPTIISFKGFAEGVLKGAREIVVTAVDPASLIPAITWIKNDFSVSPSRFLIYGQPYNISWDVEGAREVTMDAYNSPRNTVTYTTINPNYGGQHTLTIYDKSEEIEPEEITMPMHIAEFGDAAATPFPEGKITKVIDDSTGGETYFIANNAVYLSTDHLETLPEPVVTAEQLNENEEADIIHSVAVKNGNYFIGTNRGVYLNLTAEGTIKQILNTLGYQSVNSLVVTGKKILAGTQFALYEIVPSSSPSDRDGFGSRLISAISPDSNIDIQNFVLNPFNRDQLFVISSKGVFYSSDGGATFKNVHSKTYKTINGSWSAEGDVIIWSTSKVYIWDGSKFIETDEAKKLRNTAETINHVIKQGNRFFVATSGGVVSYATGEDANAFKTDLTDDCFHLLKTQINESEEFDGETISLTKRIIAITADGAQFELDWGQTGEAE